MKLLILFLSVLATNCIAVTGDSDNSTTLHCVKTWKYETFLNKRECIRLYINQHILKNGLLINTTTTTPTTPVRRRRADPGTLIAADIDPKAADPDTHLAADTDPKAADPGSPLAADIDPKTSDPGTPSAADTDPKIADPGTLSADKRPKPTGPTLLVTKKDCSSFNSVKSYFSDKWITYKNKTNITEERKYLIRMEIFNKAMSEPKLAAFKKGDFDCIRNRKENVKANCLVNILTVDVKKENIPNRISDVMARFKSINVNQNSCARSKDVGDCVKKVLTGCSPAVLNLVGDLESVTSQECNKAKETPPPRVNKMVTNVIIALACICVTTAVALGVMKYLKIRRNSAVHTITKSTPEEHEMSSTAKPGNLS